MFLAVDDEIVKIASDGAHRNIAGSDRQTGRLRNVAGESRGLDRTGYFEFLVESGQTLFGREGAMSNDVAQAADEDQIAKKLISRAEATYETKAGEVGLE